MWPNPLNEEASKLDMTAFVHRLEHFAKATPTLEQFRKHPHFDGKDMGFRYFPRLI